MMVSVKGLKKTYGNQQVLDIGTLDFEPGLTCIMGRNGCGKTTLLNILSGHLEYDAGTVTYDGEGYSKSMAHRLTMVQQKPMLLGRSVEENIAFPLKVRNYHRSEVHQRVIDVLSLLDIHDLRYKKGPELSGGEGQKVAIARALVFEPSLLLLDEPTSNIDSHSREMIEQAVKKHSNQGNTVIWVTHDREQAIQVGHRIIELKEKDYDIYSRDHYSK